LLVPPVFSLFLVSPVSKSILTSFREPPNSSWTNWFFFGSTPAGGGSANIASANAGLFPFVYTLKLSGTSQVNMSFSCAVPTVGHPARSPPLRFFLNCFALSFRTLPFSQLTILPICRAPPFFTGVLVFSRVFPTPVSFSRFPLPLCRKTPLFFTGSNSCF